MKNKHLHTQWRTKLGCLQQRNGGRGWAACGDGRDRGATKLGCVRRFGRHYEAQMRAALADARGSQNACGGSRETTGGCGEQGWGAVQMWEKRAILLPHLHYHYALIHCHSDSCEPPKDNE
ncbi:hypothetical protein S83_069799 [Arachis hypogaea]